MVKVILLTSTFRRHAFVANVVAERCDLTGVWRETKTFAPERYARDADDEAVIERHFAGRDAAEARYFDAHESLHLASHALDRAVGPGGCNDPAEVTLMASCQPDVVLVFGTGILREPLLSTFQGRIINLHLGLSPYYRGAGTNFWPLVNREPEYVGATIHYLDAGIDTGPIIAHARPDMTSRDGPHDVGNKTIVAAADALVHAAGSHAAGAVTAVPQWGGGRLYQRKDFNADAVRTLYHNFESGMIGDYLAARRTRDAVLRLIEPARV